MNRLRNYLLRLQDGQGLTTQSFVVFLFKGLGAALQFVFYFTLAKYWGREGLGLYDLLNSLVHFFGLVALFGGSKVIMQFTGRLKAEHRMDEFGGLYKKLIVVTAVLSTLFTLFLWFGGEWLATSFFQKPVLIYPLRRLGGAVAFMAFFFLNLDAMRSIGSLRTSELYRNIIRPAVGIAVLCLFLWVVARPKPGQAELYIILAAQFAGWFISSVSFIPRLRAYKFKTVLRYKGLLQTGWSLMLAMLIIMVLGVIDRVMIGRYLTLADNGSYAIALKLILPITFVLTAVNQVVAPRIAEMYFAKQIKALDRLMKRSARLIFYSSLPIILAILLLGGFVLNLFGDEYVTALPLLYILTAGYMVNVICGPVGNFLTMTGHQKAFRNLLVLAIILNIGLNLLLIPGWGVNGVAMATSVSMVVWNVLGAIYVVRKEGIHVYFKPWG